MSYPPVQFLTESHKGQSVIFIKFERHPLLEARVRALPGRTWSQTRKMWYVPDNQQYRLRFKLSNHQQEIQIPAQINKVNHEAYQKYIQLLQQKAYSSQTIKTYLQEFTQFLAILKNTPANTFTNDRINNYFHYCIMQLQLSESSVHSRINAVKFYYEKVLGLNKLTLNIVRPKKAQQLPKCYSLQEVIAILQTVNNAKHYLILSLCYGTGIRLSEILNIKIADINTDRKTIFIERAKGKKDRYVNLPQSSINHISDYITKYTPTQYLFEGQFGGQINCRTVQLIFQQAKAKANIQKPGGIHTLRHSFATHLHESGTDINIIQKLLGHNDIKTTLIYTHVSQKELGKVISPLDQLLLHSKP